MPQKRLSVVVTRRLPEVVETRMTELFDVELRDDDRPFTREELADAMRRSDVLVPTITDNIDQALLAQAGDKLKLIANFGAGVDHIDVQTARQRGILVSNTPGVLTEDTADMSMALILATARRLFARRGFHGTSTRGIAAEVGIDVSTLYYHWGNKEALFLAALRRETGRLTEVIDASLANDESTLEDQLIQGLRALFETLERSPRGMALLKGAELRPDPHLHGGHAVYVRASTATEEEDGDRTPAAADACCGRVERARGRAAGAFQDELPAHELAVVFAHCTGGRLKARIGQVGAAGELPAIAEQPCAARRLDGTCFVELVARSRIVRRSSVCMLATRDSFPLELGRQAVPRP